MQQLTERQTVQGGEVDRWRGGGRKAVSRATLTWRILNTRTDRWQDRQTERTREIEKELRERGGNSGKKGIERERLRQRESERDSALSDSRGD